MSSILSKIKFGTQTGGRPPAAVELSPEGVLAASLPGPGQPPVYAFQPFAAGLLKPGIADANLAAPDTVASGIRTALGHVSPRTRAVTLILPDTAIRIFLLDFDSLPSRAAEVDPVLRFRLRKMVPFDVEHAGISYQTLTETKTECRVLVAVIPGPILAEYEAAVQSAGYEPGAVLPCSLAAQAAIDSMEAVLIANLSSLALTTTISNGQDLLLYRTLELPHEPHARLEEVQRDIAVASAYFEDKLGLRPHRLYYAGNGDADEFARWLNDPELSVLDLAPRPETGVATALGNVSVAAVAGALAGVA